MRYKLLILLLVFGAVLANNFDFTQDRPPQFIDVEEGISGKVELGTSPFATLVEEIINNWFSFSLMAIMASFALGVIMKMGAKVFNSRILNLYANMEFKEVLISLAIFFLFVGTIEMLSLFVKQGGTYNFFVSEVIGVLDKSNDAFSSTYLSVLDRISYASLGASSSSGYSWQYPIPYYSESSPDNPAAQADIIIANKELSYLDQAYPFFAAFREFFKELLIPFSVLLIPIGMFLRSLFFTRRMGSTVLAVAFSGYIVVPILLYFMFLLAGLVEPSSPYLPGPSCPSACSSPVPSVISKNSQGYFTVDVRASMESYIESSQNLLPSENEDFMKMYNLSKGHLSQATIQGVEFYSCSNTSWTQDQDTFCPTSCRVVPFPEEIPNCREYAYQCKKLFDKTEGKCFKELIVSDYSQTIKKQVPVMKLQGQALDVEQKDAIAAAISQSCAFIPPAYIPPQIKLRESDGSKVTLQPQDQSKFFCPSPYRYIIINMTDPSQVNLVFPGEGKYDCDNFYDEVLSNTQDLLPKISALMNPGREYCYGIKLSNTQTTTKVTNIIKLKPSSLVPDNYYTLREDTTKDLDAGENGKAIIRCTSTLSQTGYCTQWEFFLNYMDLDITNVPQLNFSSGPILTCVQTQTPICLLKTDYDVVEYKLTPIFTSSSQSKISKEEAEALLRRPLDLAFSDGKPAFVYGKSLFSGSNIYSIDGTCYKFDCGTKDNPDVNCVVRNAYKLVKDAKLSIPVFISGNCQNVAAVPSEELWVPPKVDCSKCVSFARTPLTATLKSSNAVINFVASIYIKSIMIPLIVLAITAAIVSGLSSFLGGEMFIPAIGKVL